MGKLKRVIVSGMDWFLYRVISDERRKKLSEMVSTEKKEKIKRVINYGAQREKQLRIKRIKNHLYTLGFEKQALIDFKQMLEAEKKLYVKRMIAWELALWYANQYTMNDAKQALQYVQIAREGEKNKNQLRQIAIVEAESLFHLHQKDKSRDLLQAIMTKQDHPDLYLAMANLETNPHEKLAWLNKAFDMFDLAPVTFAKADNPTYNNLRMKETREKVIDEEKISIILPAYNAEDGIHVAIESILGQTWTNIELIVVDDCSTDHTVEVVKRYMELDERVKLYSTPSNSGPYIARNIGLQAATGTYITINDADDWSHEEKLARQATHLQENKQIVANTSGHARLTEEDLQFYRRGTPGKFIFPNMSSIMFRRKEVMEKLGYWNCVRFAADGEFKRRLIKVFGANRYVDLPSGPLSLPRQSVSSLTSSSAFGYNGFFMGARKEYVESLEYYHKYSNHLYYPYPVEGNLFPVPRPMWPNKVKGIRQYDEIIIGDFRLLQGVDDPIWKECEKSLANASKTIGLVQVYVYNLNADMQVHESVRQYIDGDTIQMLVYGEEVQADDVIILDEAVFERKQKYIPNIHSQHVQVVVRDTITELTEQHITTLFNQEPVWIPENNEIRKQLEGSKHLIAKQNWVNESE